MSNRTSPLVIGIAGGTGSGKTTVAQTIVERVGGEHIASLAHDSYYKDLSDLPVAQRADVNFDHPNSLDSEFMIEQLTQLKSGVAIEVPVYDFKTHSRTDHTLHVQPQPIILVEGILIFAEAGLRNLFDIKVFVDTDPDLRFIRRMERDIAERARTRESVVEQYLGTVRPMHLEFVEPSKRYADVIIPQGGYNTVAVDMIITKIRSVLGH